MRNGCGICLQEPHLSLGTGFSLWEKRGIAWQWGPRPRPRQPTRQLRLRRGMLITVHAGYRNALALCYGVWWSLSVECMHAGVTFAVHPEYKAKSKGVGLCNTLTRKRLCLRCCPFLLLCQYRYKRKVNHYSVLTVPQFPWHVQVFRIMRVAASSPGTWQTPWIYTDVMFVSLLGLHAHGEQQTIKHQTPNTV